MDTVTKKEYNVRDLGTKSVTLFPSRAQISREIKDLQLAPGLNEITIVGLTPTVDEESIKVEGTGSAIITDIAVELLPNRDIFQEIYPDSDDETATESESESDDDEQAETEELAAVRAKIVTLRDELKRAKEAIGSADSRLKILDGYGKTMLDKKKGVVVIEDGIETYRSERDKVFEDHLEGQIRERTCNKELQDLVKEEGKLLKVQAKEKAKLAKAKEKIEKVKTKERIKKARRDEQVRKEKERVRKERENFWPRYCYSVTITLDAAVYTPMSSRRASIASESDLQLVKEKSPEKATDKNGGGNESGPSSTGTCDLLLTYVTSSAFWSPSYDLQLQTTSNAATLCFDAQLTNATSETWQNARITLSTSQTTFAGLEDALPSLVPWHVKLAGRGAGMLENDILNSREERSERTGWETQLKMQNQVQKPRANLFGVSAPQQQQQMQVAWDNNMDYQNQLSKLQNRQQNYQNVIQAPDLARKRCVPQSSMMPPAPPLPAPNDMARSLPGRGGGGALLAKNKKATVGGLGGTLFGHSSSARATAASGFSSEVAAAEGMADDGDEDEDEELFDAGTIMEAVPELDFQESAVEETGLTTTYDLPGTKTLAPRSRASKQRVARMNFAGVVFSHTVVAKYRPAAYLKAKLRNTSRLTLLRGPAGLTLDGSFLGRTRLPRCSAGDSFLLSLGIDPAVRVTYPKPEVRRSTTGLFSKEDSSVYTRTVTIHNTKAAAPGRAAATIFVLDQVPVSQDERLRVEVLAPRGLSVTAGTGVGTGVPAKEGPDHKDWGKATAVLKKGGEVTWDVSLKAGRAVKLGLEYEVAVPSGERVTQC